jgi:nicotinate-nucleotide adenylyltransferase
MGEGVGKRIGVFGGSFDPIHYGHLLMAEQCREFAELDTVVFIPAAQSPLKPSAPIAQPRQRMEMLRLATSGHDAFALDTCELDRTGPSYTILTLQTWAEKSPDDELFLILGSDAVKDFGQWRAPEKILELALPLIVSRPGPRVDIELLRKYASPKRWTKISQGQVRAPLVEISSSDMRRRIAEGRSIRYMTPRAVEAYIYAQGIYRPIQSTPKS